MPASANPQVKVMLRIWPAQGVQRSAESTSYLKVDPRKKQVTLYDPAAGPPGCAGLRHAPTAPVPKMFAFDAVFPQDSEQVQWRATPGCVCRDQICSSAEWELSCLLGLPGLPP